MTSFGSEDAMPEPIAHGPYREKAPRAAHLTQCDEFPERFPKGIDTPTGDGGKMTNMLGFEYLGGKQDG